MRNEQATWNENEQDILYFPLHLNSWACKNKNKTYIKKIGYSQLIIEYNPIIYKEHESLNDSLWSKTWSLQN